MKVFARDSIERATQQSRELVELRVGEMKEHVLGRVTSIGLTFRGAQCRVFMAQEQWERRGADTTTRLEAGL